MNENVKSGFYESNGEKFEFNFRTVLRTTDKVKFINTVCGSIVNDSSKDYYSVLRNLMFNYAIINIFTDVDTSSVDESSNTIDAIENFLNNTNIVEVVIKNIDVNIIRELNDAVDKNIEYKTGIKVNSVEDALVKVLDTVDGMMKKVNINDFVKAITKLNNSTNELTADKLLDAYSKTDMFKKKIEELKN